jgi:hypothetical protein
LNSFIKVNNVWIASFSIALLNPELKATTPVPRKGSIYCPSVLGAMSIIQDTNFVFMP